MYLKSLELMGFKSFARKTVFTFGPGITAIIGPNGSGKSNVCDAIRWVLGEQSSKTLRGSSMRDVIFAGTPAMRSASFAAVKLVLDNEDRRLPLDFTEVSLARELYRSGESNYYLNADRTLLGTIREMLMDTGIGQEGYSVIGQGVIDDIIFQRIQNRRSLIEEAAGITKFKHRKASALTKLDHTQANITRVRDIVNEIEGQLGPLAEQAARTRQHQDLTNRIRSLEIDLLVFDLVGFYQERENVASMKRGLVAKLEEIQQFIEELKAKKDGTHSELAGFETEIARLKEVFNQVGGRLEVERQAAYKLKEELRENHTRREYIGTEIEQLSVAIANGTDEMTAATATLTKLEEDHAATTQAVSDAAAAETKAQESLAEHLRQLTRNKDSAFQVAMRLSEGKNKLASAQQQIDMLNRQLNRGGGEYDDLSTAIALLERDTERVVADIDALNRELVLETVVIDKDRRECQDLDRQVARLEEQATSLADQVKIAHARRHAIEELQSRNEGSLNRGVRELLARKDRELPGVCGIVGDLIKVPRGQEVAFETALGGSIQDMIVRDSATAEAGIAMLKQNKWGRVTFLPLDMLRPPPRLEAPRVQGCLGVALDLVEFDPQYYQAMVHLLGRVLIFERLDAAVAYAKGSRDFNRIVTIEGDVVRSSGAMTGGAEAGKGGGMLSRKRELEDLVAKAEKLELEEKSARSQLGTRRTRRDQLMVSVREREDKLNRRKQSLEFLQHRRDDVNKKMAEKRAVFAQIEADREELSAQRQRLETESAELRAAMAELEQENAAIAKRQASQSGVEDELRNGLLKAQKAMADGRVKEAQYAEQIKAARREIEATKKRHDNAEKKRKAAIDERERLIKALADYETKLAEHTNAGNALETEQKQLAAELETATERYRKMAQSIEALDRQHQSRLKMEEATRAKLNELDVKLAEINAHAKQKEEVLVNEYGFDLNEGLSQVRKVDSRDSVVTRLSDLRAERQSLEPVNPLAIEDYERTKERHEFLLAQIKDLTDAADSLNKVIAEIERISIERYRETFASINSAFGEIFQILFPGGNAHLKLTNPDAPLESNVEIHAQLPGKKLTTLELFSGGEKTLISISMLFAILQVKPPAFCLLDEVEAALDEANVRRFCRLLRSFADKTQFLLITHNKETMQAVDTLYGITLEKTGISRPISIRFEDHDKVREFTTNKPELAKTA